jgi:anti-sigma B factor antagonist
MPLQTHIASHGGVSVLRCAGRLVYGEEAAELDRTVRGLFDHTKQIVLNLADVPIIDSGGVGALGGLFMAAHNREVQIRLSSLSPRVAEVLRITGLAMLFDIYDTDDEAVNAFQTLAAAAQHV